MRRRGELRHEIDCELPAAWLGAVLDDTDAEVDTPGRVRFDVSLQPQDICLATGHLQLQLRVPCGRCLEPARVDGSTRILATFVRGDPQADRGPGAGVDDDGVGLIEEDLDTWRYDGSTLPLDDVVAEYIKLAYPMRALCERGEACRGLCTGCGAQLDEQPPGRRCLQCGVELEGPSTGPLSADDAEAEGPMAEALRKLQLPE
jgi:uncharacterized metal-binding protein YceD (DUF177 family)